MNNYYNILPIILIDVFIILLFEGIMFFLYLIIQQTNIVSNEITAFFESINKTKLSLTFQETRPLFDAINTQLNKIMPPLMQNEKIYIEKEYNNGLQIYIAIMIIIILIIIGYVYIVRTRLKKEINWTSISITVIITFVLIVVMELLYIKYVLFKKHFNNTQIQLDFLNALTKS